MVSVGAKLPDFELEDQDGKTVRSSDLMGKPCVLYFYPKDFTPGCTTEADEFSAKHKTFQRRKITVVGVSPDGPDSHKKFCAKMGIKYTLLADKDHTLAAKLGVWGKKKFMGREYMGVNRTTFLIDAGGIIVKIFEKVKPAGHAEAVLAYFDGARRG